MKNATDKMLQLEKAKVDALSDDLNRLEVEISKVSQESEKMKARLDERLKMLEQQMAIARRGGERRK